MNVKDDGFFTVVGVLSAYLFAVLYALVLVDFLPDVMSAAIQAGAVIVSAFAAIYAARKAYRSVHIPIIDKEERYGALLLAAVEASFEELKFIRERFCQWAGDGEDDKTLKNYAYFCNFCDAVEGVDLSPFDNTYIVGLKREDMRRVLIVKRKIAFLKWACSQYLSRWAGVTEKYGLAFLLRDMSEDIDASCDAVARTLDECIAICDAYIVESKSL